MNADNCIALYPFTAPVQGLVMENYFLHALTETGLESYTLRFGHQLARSFEVIDNVNVVSWSWGLVNVSRVRIKTGNAP